MTSPAAGGSSDELERLRGRPRPDPGARPRAPASRRMSATPSDACSDVPHPVTMTGSPAVAVVAIAAASARPPAVRARLAREDPAGQRGLGRDHVGHVIRRAGPRGSACRCEAHGSGGPGRGAVGSKPSVVVIEREDRLEVASAGSATHGARRAPGSVVAPNASPWRHRRAASDGSREEDRMQVGLMAPQGWKGEYDGWAAGRRLGADRRARRAGRGARLRVPLGLRPLPHGARADRRDHLRVRSRSSPRWRWRPRGSASATWSSAPGSATRR